MKPTIGSTVSAFADDALGRDDASALADRVAAGDVSPSELVESAIARCERVQPELNAVAVWDVDRARQRASDNDFVGAFAGVPTFVKGTSAVAGLPLRFGSRATPETPMTDDGPETAQFLSAGLVNLGISALPEFGATASTEPALTGVTRNPWSLEHSPGGSSGGAASLVAAGAVPIAHGNDGGGSIRIPASCCGLVGLKPSRGRMAAPPLPKVFPIDPGVNGVLTRTVRDTARAMLASERYQPAAGLKPIGEVTGPAERRLRIGVVTERFDGLGYDSANLAELLRIAALLEEMGHEVDLIQSPFADAAGDEFLLMWAFFPFLLWHGGAKVFGEGWDRDRLEPFTKWLVKDFRRRSATAPLAFRRLRRWVDTRYPLGFEGFDVLMDPTLNGPTHRIGHLSPELPGELHIARARAQVSTTWLHNAGGGPAISLPLGAGPNGLPLGVQFSAPIGEEARLLALAFELEAASPFRSLADVV